MNLESSTPGHDEIWSRMSHPKVEQACPVWPVMLPGILVLLLSGARLPVMPKGTVSLDPSVSVLLCLKQRARCSEMHDN